MKFLDKLPAFLLGTVVAVAVMFVTGIWEPPHIFGLATESEVGALKERIATLDQAMRESEAKIRAELEINLRAAEARAAEAAARKAADAARAAADARAKAEADSAMRARLAQQRDADVAARKVAEAVMKAREDADRRAAADKARAEQRQQAAAADEFDRLYQQALAMEGEGNSIDALRIYRRATRAGSGKAAKRLGEIFDCGIPGVPRDYAESLQWYETARQLGEQVETAGKRVCAAGPVIAVSSLGEAENLYRQAVAMESGGNARDAVRIYRRAARGGSGKAAKRLGDIMNCGAPGVARDYAQSLLWYDTAFRLGESVPTTAKGDSC